jgi:hypothetical protein
MRLGGAGDHDFEDTLGPFLLFLSLANQTMNFGTNPGLDRSSETTVTRRCERVPQLRSAISTCTIVLVAFYFVTCGHLIKLYTVCKRVLRTLAR